MGRFRIGALQGWCFALGAGAAACMTGARGDACDTNSDCPAPALCIGGTCGVPCNTDAECGAETVCRTGLCAPRGVDDPGPDPVPDVDECDLGTDTCDDNATCTNTDGAFTCACNEGYAGSGAVCEDVDECDLGLDDCDPRARCTNAVGGFACSCCPTCPSSLFVGIQGQQSSYVLKLRYDPQAPTQTAALGNVELTSFGSGTFGGGIRALTWLADGTILAGDVESTAGGEGEVVADNLQVVSPLTFQGGGTAEIANVHGLCGLPNGHIIAGEYNGAPAGGARANEYDGAGTFVRAVYVSTTAYGGLSDCVVTADGATLFLVDGDTWGTSAGAVARLELQGAAWVETQRLSPATLDAGAGSHVWSLVLHTSGDLYVGPYGWTPAAGRLDRLVHCPGGTLTSGCATVGQAIPTDGTTGMVEGIAQVPCSADLFVETMKSVYYYSAAAGTYTKIYDLTPTMPEFAQPRKLLAR